MEQATVSIGAAARMTGISANTLRMWERRYKLGSTRRSSSGQREYTTTDIDHLKLINKLVKSGLRIGDIARLPSKTLAGLAMENGVSITPAPDKTQCLRTRVIGLSACNYFEQHIKRYPKLEFDFVRGPLEQGLEDTTPGSYDALVVHLDALNNVHIEALRRLSETRVYVIVLYLYSSEEVIQHLHSCGIETVEGGINQAGIDAALAKATRLFDNIEATGKAFEKFDIALPSNQPRKFEEAELISAEKLSNLLNCECPPHVTDLIRRLSAFEEYSQNCEVENWKQASIHACIYAYTNQARYLMEKALQAVLDE